MWFFGTLVCLALGLLAFWIKSLLLFLQHVSSIQLSRSVMSESANPWSAANKASLSITNSQSLLKLMSVESVMPSNHLILCRPALLLPSISPSIRVFPNESALCIRWPEYWSFSFNMSPSNEHSGLISFRMGWLDLLAIQGTLKSLLQHHSSKPSILQLLLDLHTGFSRGSSGGLVFSSLRIFHSLLWSTQSKD